MKNIKISIPLILALLFGACTDLDLQPLSTTTAGVVFTDEASYMAFAAKVYAGLATTGQQGPAGDGDIKGIDEGFSNYLRQYWQLQELTTEEAVIGWGDEGLPDLNAHTWTSANQFITATFNRIFFQVSMANEFLRETTEGKLNERGVSAGMKATITELRAEIRFLRALSYWHALDLFGSVPFFTEDQAVGADAPDQVNRAELFSFLESELAEIEQDMVPAGENEYARADRAAVWMLQAKLFLNAEVYVGTPRYSDAITALDKLINSGAFALEEEYLHNFLADNHTSTEIIFPVAFDGLRTLTWGGMTYLVNAPIGGSMSDISETEYGIQGGWGGLRTTSLLVDLFPDETGNTDTRALFYTDGQNKEITTIESFNDGYAVPKYRNVNREGEPGQNQTHPDTDFPMFRLADAYLMYAEAVVRGGSGGSMSQAVSLINELRERAYKNTAGNITEADLTLDFILDERSRELFWEGHRRTDLIRYGRYASKIWPFKGNVTAGQASEDFRTLFPIPSSELLANPKLSQNSGY